MQHRCCHHMSFRLHQAVQVDNSNQSADPNNNTILNRRCNPFWIQSKSSNNHFLHTINLRIASAICNPINTSDNSIIIGQHNNKTHILINHNNIQSAANNNNIMSNNNKQMEITNISMGQRTPVTITSSPMLTCCSNNSLNYNNNRVVNSK